MTLQFRKHFGYLVKRKPGGVVSLSQKLLYSNIIDTIFTECTHRFAELQDFIFSPDIRDLLDDTKINFLKSLFLIKEKWATAHIPFLFNAG